MHKCIYLQKTSKGKIQSLQGQCDHADHEHRNGICWHIVNPELTDKNTTKKYCKCVQNPGNIKPFALIGYTEQEPEDWMIPKACIECDKILLLRVEENICNTCQINANFK